MRLEVVSKREVSSGENLSKGQLKIMKEVSQGEVLSLQPPTERGTSDTKNRPLKCPFNKGPKYNSHVKVFPVKTKQWFHPKASTLGTQ